MIGERRGAMRKKRVIVLGVDGLDPKICRELMAKGQLPHLAGMSERGAFSDLLTVNPPQSPVAWAGMATGTNAGRHGVFDFITANPKTYMPGLSILRPGKPEPGKPGPAFAPPFQGRPFWDIVAQAGLPATALRWPLTFPASPGKAVTLAGLGAPDVKGKLGNYVFYTDAPDEAGHASRGQTVRLSFVDGRAGSAIQGPLITVLGRRKAVEVPLALSLEESGAVLRVGGHTERLEAGRWSGFVPVLFDLGRGETTAALTRFFLTSLAPLQLYMGPLQLDPRSPRFPLTNPAGYAAELAGALGPFATLGMPEETKGLTEDRLSDEAFLSMCDEITTEREKMFEFELSRFKEGLLACVFDASDRIQHMFWRLRDKTHPLYDPAVDRRLGPVIDDHYRRMDAVVGRALAACDDRTALLVCSDHGFASYSRSVNLNTWLAEAGYMALKDHDPEASGELFQFVDWSRTKAYAVGFGSVRLNLAGRERDGVVAPGEAASLAREIASRLEGLCDQDGTFAVARVHFRDDILWGPLAPDGPDMVVGCRPPYRVSWATAIGGLGKEVFEDNRQKWSGDHCVDASFVPGSFFSNLPVRFPDGPPRQTRLAATVLSLLGLPLEEGMDASIFEHA